MVPTAEELGMFPEVYWYMQDRGFELPELWQKPLIQTPLSMPENAVFDPERVDRVIKVFRALRHTSGEWAGKVFEPSSWQVAWVLAPIFGWVMPNRKGDMVRVIRSAWVELPRKNGKTSLSAIVAIYLTTSDGEPGAQVYAAATDLKQAEHCFRPIAQLAVESPLLSRHVKHFKASHKIIHPRSGSFFQAISRIGDSQHGANVSGAVIDEVHLHKSNDLIEAIETGTGARRQPLLFYITTADDGKPDSPYEKKRKRVEKLADGIFTNPREYGVVWAAAKSERDLEAQKLDPFGEETQKRANPGWGVSPTAESLEDDAQRAKESPADYASYLRLHLGIRTKQFSRWISLGDWDASAGTLDEFSLAGRECYGGLDVASVSDVTAFCLTFPFREHDIYQNLWRFWVPEDTLPGLINRTAGEARVWVDQGYLNVTPGNVIDNQIVVDSIIADSQNYDIVEVNYDRWGATDISRRLDDAGIQCIGLYQGYPTYSGPMKEMLRLIKLKRYVHGGNPVMRWMIDNLVVAIDSQGNYKPDKAKAADKIDGVSAAGMAMHGCMLANDGFLSLDAFNVGR